MLDYDALRSKVRKLTEKPDKDPAKLPRTEKETEMVGSSASSFVPLSSALLFTTTATSSSLILAPSGDRGSGPDSGSGSSSQETHSTSDPDLLLDLTVPSPSKILQRPDIERVRRLAGLSLGTSPSLASGNTSGANTSGASRFREGLESLGRALGAAPDEVVLTQPTGSPGIRRSFSLRSGFEESTTPDDGDTAAGYCDESDDGGDGASSRTVTARRSSSPSLLDVRSILASTTTQAHSRAPDSQTLPFPDSSTTLSSTSAHFHAGTANPSTGLRTWKKRLPFFTLAPSELEDLMAPLATGFKQRQADMLMQAKAAYEQLNDQLTNELPQVIDLRYVFPPFPPVFLPLLTGGFLRCLCALHYLRS